MLELSLLHFSQNFERESPRGEMHPHYAMLVLCRARPDRAVDGGGRLTLLALALLLLLLTQELEYRGEIFIGITTCAHHTIHLMG